MKDDYESTPGQWALIITAFTLLLFGAPLIEWLLGGLL